MNETTAFDLFLVNETGLGEIWMNFGTGHVLIWGGVLDYEIRWRETVVSGFF